MLTTIGLALVILVGLVHGQLTSSQTIDGYNDMTAKYPYNNASTAVFTAIARHPNDSIWFIGVQGAFFAFFPDPGQSLLALETSYTTILSNQIRVLVDYSPTSTDQLGSSYAYLATSIPAYNSPTKIILDPTTGTGFLLEAGYRSLFSADQSSLWSNSSACNPLVAETGDCRFPTFLEDGADPRFSRIWSFNYTAVTQTGPLNLNWKLLWNGDTAGKWQQGVVSTMAYDSTNNRLWVFTYELAFTINPQTGSMSPGLGLKDSNDALVFISCATTTSTHMIMSGAAGWYFITPLDNFNLDDSLITTSILGFNTIGTCLTFTYPGNGRTSVFLGASSGNLFELDATSFAVRRFLKVVYYTSDTAYTDFPIYSIVPVASKNYLAIGSTQNFEFVDLGDYTGPLSIKVGVQGKMASIPTPAIYHRLAVYEPVDSLVYFFGISSSATSSLARPIDNSCYNIIASNPILGDCGLCMQALGCGVCERTGYCGDMIHVSSTNNCSTTDFHAAPNYTCPQTIKLSPNNADIQSGLNITVTGSNFPAAYTYQCKFHNATTAGANTEVNVTAIYVDSTTLLCPVPSSWPLNGTEQSINLDIFVTSPFFRIWDDRKYYNRYPGTYDRNPRSYFDIYDCTSFSCDQCNTASHSSCVWCASATSIGCMSNSSCTSEAVPVCPVFIDATESTVPKQGGTQIVFTVSALPTTITLMCTFDTGTLYHVTATLNATTNTVTCVFPDVSGSYPAGTPQIPITVSLTFDSDTLTWTSSSSLLKVHDCGQLSRCDQCQSFPGCNYCASTNNLLCSPSSSTCSGTSVTTCPTYTSLSSYLLGSGDSVTIVGTGFDLFSTYAIGLNCYFSATSTTSPVTISSSTQMSCSGSSVASAASQVDVMLVDSLNSARVYAPLLDFEAYDCSDDSCAGCLDAHPACNWCPDSNGCSATTCTGTTTTNITQCPSRLTSVDPNNSPIQLGVTITLTGTFNAEGNSTYKCHFNMGSDDVYSDAVLVSTTTATCRQVSRPVTPFAVGTGFVRLVKGNGLTAWTNSLPFSYHSCTGYSSCDTCTASSLAGCSWCGLTCLSGVECGSDIRTCPTITSIDRPSFHVRGGESVTVSSGPFLLPSSSTTLYSCSWRAQSALVITQGTSVSGSDGNFATALRCVTPVWPYPTGPVTLEILYDGQPLSANDSIVVNIFTCNASGSQCSSACMSQQFCGWCLGSSQCSDSGQGCPGLWVSQQCLSTFSYLNHAAAASSGQTQIVTFAGSIVNVPINSTDFVCSFGSETKQATLTNSQTIECPVPPLVASTMNFEVFYSPANTVPLSLASGIFATVDCGQYKSCSDCVQGSQYCGWCIEQNLCSVDLQCTGGLCYDSGNRTNCPLISSLEPNSGGISGGDTVTIHGQCFAQNNLQVVVGSTEVQFTRVSDSELTFVTPNAKTGSQTVNVNYNRNGSIETFAIQTQDFTYSDSITAPVAAGVVVPVVVIAAIIVAVILILRYRKQGGLQIKLVEPDYQAVAFTSDREPKFKMNGDLSKLEAELRRPDFAWQLLLDPITGATEQDDVAKSFVFLSYIANSAVSCINAVVRNEVLRCEFENTIFRGNSMASKMFKFYSRMIGIKYLFGCLARFLAELAALSSDESKDSDSGSFLSIEMEVDPDKVEGDFDKDTNTMQLILVCQKMFSKLNSSLNQIPLEFRQIFTEIDRIVMSKFGSVEASCKAIGGFFYLRFVCPSVTAPHAYGLLPRSPNEPLQRQVVLISKVLQSLANLTAPGKKEAYMESVNDFIEKNIPKMQAFYDQLRQPSNTATSASDITVPNVVRDNALCYVWSQMVGSSKKIKEALAKESDKTVSSELTSAFDDMLSNHPDKPSKVKAKKKV